jgi:ABC-2 type transport system ATP-binding protein
MNTIIKINDLTKSYGSLNALVNVNLELEKGKIIGLLGPNGSGKTTLIKVLTGLLKQYSGTIYIDGQLKSNKSKL